MFKQRILQQNTQKYLPFQQVGLFLKILISQIGNQNTWKLISTLHISYMKEKEKMDEKTKPKAKTNKGQIQLILIVTIVT